jgi:hypothetical protein
LLRRDGPLEPEGASVISVAQSIRLACRSDYDVALPEVDVMELNKTEAVEVLNRIVELELSGAVRYTQYSLISLDCFSHYRKHRVLARMKLRPARIGDS